LATDGGAQKLPGEIDPIHPVIQLQPVLSTVSSEALVQNSNATSAYRIVTVFNLAIHLMESSAVLTPSIET
jgi:hypothetical protein